MKNLKNRFIYPLFITIVALLIVGGTYAYIQNKQGNQSLAAQTGDWKIYTNSQYGFELKYPDNEPKITSRTPFNYSECALAGEGPGGSASTKVTIAGREYCLIEVSGVEPGTFSTQYEYISRIGSEDIGIVFSVSGKSTEPKVVKEAQTLFTQILSTFKPTSSTAQTSDWKTYTNTKYSYSFQYPSSSVPFVSENGDIVYITDNGKEVFCEDKTRPGCGPIKLSISGIEFAGKQFSAINAKHMTFSGYSAVEFDGAENPKSVYETIDSPYRRIVIDKNGEIITIIQDATSVLLGNILSTFKVISLIAPTANSSTTLTADWKTYTNAKYGFEIRYPQDLTLVDTLNENFLDLGENGNGFRFVIHDAKYAAPEGAVGQDQRFGYRYVHFSVVMFSTQYLEIEKEAALESGDSTREKIGDYDVTFYKVIGATGPYPRAYFYTDKYLIGVGSWQADLMKSIISTFKFTSQGKKF